MEFALITKQALQWVSEEVKLAKKKGYCITGIYEVYHFPGSSTSLFRSYIDLFLKIKQESSGWPEVCDGRRQIEAHSPVRRKRGRQVGHRKTLSVGQMGYEREQSSTDLCPHGARLQQDVGGSY